MGEPRMGWAEPPGHPEPGQLALTGRGGRRGGSYAAIFLNVIILYINIWFW